MHHWICLLQEKKHKETTNHDWCLNAYLKISKLLAAHTSLDFFSSSFSTHLLLEMSYQEGFWKMRFSENSSKGHSCRNDILALLVPHPEGEGRSNLNLFNVIQCGCRMNYGTSMTKEELKGIAMNESMKNELGERVWKISLRVGPSWLLRCH